MCKKQNDNFYIVKTILNFAFGYSVQFNFMFFDIYEIIDESAKIIKALCLLKLL